MQRIGHYEIVSELGRGGMGVVYKAHEASLNRFVAIKVLGEHLEGETEYVERFLREARSAAALSHPNIVQIYAIAEDAGHHYFVMEYVQGSNVQRMIQTRGRIPPVEAAGLLLQAAAGLEEAHGQGVIHRDIKPANLMVTERGLVKIADFGLALMGGATTRLTATGMLMGTPGYLSPEQCLDKPADQRTDIYSLGVTFFEMLTGTMPFRADSPLALLKLIVEVEPPDIRELNPEIDETLRDIVSGMLAKSPDERTASCSGLIADLETWLDVRGERGHSGAGRTASASGPGQVPPPPPGAEDDINTQPTVAVASGATEPATAPPPVPPPPNRGITAAAGEADPAPEPLAVRPVTHPPPAPRRLGLGLIVAAVAILLLAAAGVAAVLVARSGVLDRFVNRTRPTVAEPAASRAETHGAVAGSIGESDADSGIAEAAPAVGSGADETAGSADESARSAPSAETGAPADAPAKAAPAELPTRDHDTVAAPSGAAAVGGPPKDADAGSAPSEVVLATTGTVVVALGERLLAGEAEAYVKSRLAAAGVELVEVTSIPGFEGLFDTEQRPAPEEVQEAFRPHVRYLVPVRVEYLGNRPIMYMGQRDVVHSARVSIGAMDLADGRLIGKPRVVTVEYTQLNAERVVSEDLRRPATALVRILPRN